jgi:enoyl-CoA hydratase/carnithine racemase
MRRSSRRISCHAVHYHASPSQCLVIAAESSPFKLPEASLGVFVTGGLTATLATLAPHVVSRYKKVLNEIGLGQFHRALEAETEAQRAVQG